jgi:hypothetical protein
MEVSNTSLVQIMLLSPSCGLGAIADCQLAQNSADVVLDCAVGEMQSVGNFLIGLALP